MRAPILRLLLAFAIASGPVGAFAHALSHLQNPSPDSAAAGAPQGHYCVVCAAYHALGHGAANTAAAVAAPHFDTVPPPASDREVLMAEVPPFAIRAPPA